MKPPVPVKPQENQPTLTQQQPTFAQIADRINQQGVEHLNRLAKEQPNYQVPY
jgi:hypothetical protein